MNYEFFVVLHPECIPCSLAWVYREQSKFSVGWSIVINKKILPLPKLHLCNAMGSKFVYKSYSFGFSFELMKLRLIWFTAPKRWKREEWPCCWNRNMIEKIRIHRWPWNAWVRRKKRNYSREVHKKHSRIKKRNRQIRKETESTTKNKKELRK